MMFLMGPSQLMPMTSRHTCRISILLTLSPLFPLILFIAFNSTSSLASSTCLSTINLPTPSQFVFTFLLIRSVPCLFFLSLAFCLLLTSQSLPSFLFLFLPFLFFFSFLLLFTFLSSLPLLFFFLSSFAPSLFPSSFSPLSLSSSLFLFFFFFQLL